MPRSAPSSAVRHRPASRSAVPPRNGGLTPDDLSALAERRRVFDEVAARAETNLDLLTALFGLSSEERDTLRADVRELLLRLVVLTGSELASLLVVSNDTISQWCREGQFPHARILNRAGWRIPISSALAACTTTVPDEGAAAVGPATSAPRMSPDAAARFDAECSPLRELYR